MLAATEAMKHLSPTGRLSLYCELDLDLLSASQKTERNDEVEHRKPGARQRAAARGLPERQLESREPVDLDAEFTAAFFEVASSSDLALPIVELNDRVNLKLVLARAALVEERRKRYAGFLNRNKGCQFGAIDISVLFADLNIRYETFDVWYKKLSEMGVSGSPFV